LDRPTIGEDKGAQAHDLVDCRLRFSNLLCDPAALAGRSELAGSGCHSGFLYLPGFLSLLLTFFARSLSLSKRDLLRTFLACSFSFSKRNLPLTRPVRRRLLRAALTDCRSLCSFSVGGFLFGGLD